MYDRALPHLQGFVARRNERTEQIVGRMQWRVKCITEQDPIAMQHPNVQHLSQAPHSLSGHGSYPRCFPQPSLQRLPLR